MALAEARSLCPGLTCLEHDAVADRRALEALGRWMTRFTPSVATGWAAEPDAKPIPSVARRGKRKASSAPADNDGDAPAVLFLDVAGCERLFRGIAALVGRVAQCLRQFGIPARIAAAPTAGGAWAFASTGVLTNPIVDADCLRDRLRPLPVAALRLSTDVVAALHHLGITTIGQVLDLPRDALPARFGPTLLLRLDQATGDRIEPLVPLDYDPPVTARMLLDGPADSLEAIGAIFQSLLGQIVDDLTRRGRGVRQLDLMCGFDPASRRPDVIKNIHLSRPTRHTETLWGLIRCVIERIDGGREGFVAFGIKVPAHERIADEQADLIEDDVRADDAEADRLMERLRVRLGDAAVIRPVLVESYLPELAWKPAGKASGNPGPARPLPNRSRPLCLFRVPEEVRVISEPSDERVGRPRQFTWRGRVHPLALAAGPERIAGEWWRGHHKTRDYYEVEDERGLRFWLFRVVSLVPDASVPSGARLTARWFLHGRFG